MQDRPIFGTRIKGCPYAVRPSAYALVRNAGGELAVVRTAQGCFLPGGGIKDGETPEQAVQRESKEECGLVLTPGEEVGKAVELVLSAAENACFEKDSVFLEAGLVASAPAQEPDHELLWVSLEQAMDLLTYESQRWAVRRLSRRGS